MEKLILPFSLNAKELNLIESRIKEFKDLNKKESKFWFSELCFCLLTANSQAKKAIDIQNFIGVTGFLDKSESTIANIIKTFGHRFHNTKAKYIALARKYINIKEILEDYLKEDIKTAREFLVKNIKGLGYKEASHFLRNIGFNNIAIIDRHIIKFLYKYNFIKEIPKIINKKVYLNLEELLTKFNIDLNKLDLMIWYHMTGVILK